MATISNELVAEVMRHKMECKDALQIKGSFYVGTGRTETIQSKDIPETTGFDPSENNNGVLIRDTTDTNETGWRVDKITADNLEGGRVAQATNADKVLVSTDTYKPLVDALLELIYPVGSIYMTVDKDSDPAAFLGGTWERWGQGRVPVGVDENDTIFEKAENKGGEQKHQLITSEMPNHRHRGQYAHTETYTDHAQKPTDPPAQVIEVEQGTREVEVQYNVVKDTLSTTTLHTVVLARLMTSFTLTKSQAHMVLPTTVGIFLTITYNHISHVICGNARRRGGINGDN